MGDVKDMKKRSCSRWICRAIFIGVTRVRVAEIGEIVGSCLGWIDKRGFSGGTKSRFDWLPLFPSYDGTCRNGYPKLLNAPACLGAIPSYATWRL